jgi:hypothetical protein
VAVALQTATQLDTFLVSTTGALNLVADTSSGWQSPVARTGASVFPPGAPVAALSQGGQTSAFAIDANGALEIVWWNPVLGWLGPTVLTASHYAPAGGNLATGVRANGEIDVFSVGTDGALKYMAFNGTTWSGPFVLSSTNFAPPGAPLAGALDVHGYFNIMTIGNDGKLYTDWDVTPLWSGVTALTSASFAPLGGRLAAINYNNTSINAFLVDNTGTIQTLSNAGVGWNGPTAIGTSLARPGTQVSVVLENVTQLDVFAVAAIANSGVIESVKSGTSWSTPANLP